MSVFRKIINYMRKEIDHWEVRRLEQIEYQLSYELKIVQERNPEKKSDTLNLIEVVKSEELVNVRMKLAEARRKQDQNRWMN